MRFAHRGLDVERLNVLPVLLQERDEEVNAQVQVGDDLVIGHVHVADRDGEAEDLLHLELDGGLDVVHLTDHVVLVSQHGGKLTRLVQTGSQETGNLLDERFGREEGVVTLGKLLHQFLKRNHEGLSSDRLGEIRGHRVDWG